MFVVDAKADSALAAVRAALAADRGGQAGEPAGEPRQELNRERGRELGGEIAGACALAETDLLRPGPAGLLDAQSGELIAPEDWPFRQPGDWPFRRLGDAMRDTGGDTAGDTGGDTAGDTDDHAGRETPFDAIGFEWEDDESPGGITDAEPVPEPPFRPIREIFDVFDPGQDAAVIADFDPVLDRLELQCADPEGVRLTVVQDPDHNETQVRLDGAVVARITGVVALGTADIVLVALS